MSIHTPPPLSPVIIKLTDSLFLLRLALDKKKSHIRETPNLLIATDSSTNNFVTAGVKKGADSNFLSHVTCHVSCVTFHKSCEVNRWRVCYQRGLPRLVWFIIIFEWQPLTSSSAPLWSPCALFCQLYLIVLLLYVLVMVIIDNLLYFLLLECWDIFSKSFAFILRGKMHH